MDGMNEEERRWLNVPSGSRRSSDSDSKRKRKGEENDVDDDQQEQKEEKEVCEPDQSERQCFEANKEIYIKHILEMNSDSDLPGFIVGYAPVMARVGAVLKEKREGGGGGWVMERRIRNCMVQTDDDTDCFIEIWKRA